jgi:hypothetical protein
VCRKTERRFIHILLAGVSVSLHFLFYTKTWPSILPCVLVHAPVIICETVDTFSLSFYETYANRSLYFSNSYHRFYQHGSRANSELKEALPSFNIRECIQNFPDWLPGERTANGATLCHYMQLYRYFVSHSGEFCCHNPSCFFSVSVYCCCFCCSLCRYRLSPETFVYTFVPTHSIIIIAHTLIIINMTVRNFEVMSEN